MEGEPVKRGLGRGVSTVMRWQIARVEDIGFDRRDFDFRLQAAEFDSAIVRNQLHVVDHVRKSSAVRKFDKLIVLEDEASNRGSANSCAELHERRLVDNFFLCHKGILRKGLVGVV